MSLEEFKTALSQYGVIEYCGENGDPPFCFIVAINSVNTDDKNALDLLCDSYLFTIYTNKIPSTLEYGIYKVSYDNFPN